MSCVQWVEGRQICVLIVTTFSFLVQLPISGTSVTMAIAKPVIEREACALKVAVFSDGEVSTPVPEIQVNILHHYQTSIPSLQFQT